MISPNPASIRSFLDSLSIPYRHLTHAPTATSEESAAARGEPLEVGAKALLLKLDGYPHAPRGDDSETTPFSLFILSAARKLDSAAVKKHHGVKSTRFASREELLQLTGLVPGSIPPFGRPILPFDLYIDAAVPTLPRVAFNCASLTESIIMQTAHYLRAANPSGTYAFSASA